MDKENLYFESHAHYDDEIFDTDREELLGSFPSFSIGVVINAGADMEGSEKGMALAAEYPFFYAAAGVHPHEVKSLQNADMDKLRTLCDYEKTVAVGEIGLDYYYDYSPRDLQAKWFIEQIKIANEKKLPILVHSRDACADTFKILKENAALNKGYRPGVIHCFSGNCGLAVEYVKMGWYIGVGGVVTYKNAKKLVEVVDKIPLENLLIETDCPYLSPEPNRGKRNDSRNLVHIVKRIAEIKGVSPETVMDTTFSNGMELFKKVAQPSHKP